MKRYDAIEAVPHHRETAVTIGTFDGVHVGHRRIIEATVQKARDCGGQSVVISFDPHPQHVLRPQQPLALLTRTDEKAALLVEMGTDALLVLPFTHDLAALSPEAFVRDLLVKRLGVCHLVVGFDHAFGRGREGHHDNLARLGKRYGFDVTVIAPVTVDGEPVSSTRIRQTLAQGRVEEAGRLLGRPFSLRGPVVKGEGLGRKLGFPTANLGLDAVQLDLLADGVYAAKVQYGGQSFSGMANVGSRPSVPGRTKGVEVHLFDFDGDLYGQTLGVQFIGRIRDERKFDSMEVLVAQMRRDQLTSLGLLNNPQ